MLHAPRDDALHDALSLEPVERRRPMERSVLDLGDALDLDDYALDGPVQPLRFIGVIADGGLECVVIDGTCRKGRSNDAGFVDENWR